MSRWAAGAIFGFSLIVACSSENLADPPPPFDDAIDSGASSSSSGSSSSSTSSSGGPMIDGGTEASVNPCAGRRVCDSFESAAVGMPPSGIWSVEKNGGSAVTVSTDHAFSGTKSMKFTTSTGQYQQAYLTSTASALFPLPNNLFYGRMMVWMTTSLTNGVHWTMVSGVGPLSGVPSTTAFYRYGGMWGGAISANYDTIGKNTDCWDHSTKVVPIGRWACVTWRFAAANNELSMSLDGADVNDAHVTGSGEGCVGNDLGGVWRAPNFNKVQLGWESYQQDGGHTMYIDDVILDDKPIACP